LSLCFPLVPFLPRDFPFRVGRRRPFGGLCSVVFLPPFPPVGLPFDGAPFSPFPGKGFFSPIFSVCREKFPLFALSPVALFLPLLTTADGPGSLFFFSFLRFFPLHEETSWDSSRRFQDEQSSTSRDAQHGFFWPSSSLFQFLALFPGGRSPFYLPPLEPFLISFLSFQSFLSPPRSLKRLIAPFLVPPFSRRAFFVIRVGTRLLSPHSFLRSQPPAL